MVNVYGDFSETGYNNPYSGTNTSTPSAPVAAAPPMGYEVPAAKTRAEADAGNVVGQANLAKIGVSTPYGEWIAKRQNEPYLPYIPPVTNQERYLKQQEQIQQTPSKNYLDRPDYVEESNLGDTRTQQLIGQGYTPEQALTIQKNETTDSRAQRYYENERQKALQSNISKSGGYHVWARDTGIPQSPNPYEYVADLSLYTLKGTQGKDAKFSPVSPGVLGLPKGEGLQDQAWAQAVARDKGRQIPQSGNYNQAMDVIATAKRNRQMGPYGQLNSFSSGQGNLSLAKQQEIGIKAANSAGWAIRPDLQDSNPAMYDNQYFGNPKLIGLPPIPSKTGGSYWMKNGIPVEKDPATFNGMKIVSLGVAPKQGLISAPLPANDTIMSGYETFQHKLSNKIYGGIGMVSGVSAEQAKQSVYLSDTIARAQSNVNPSPRNLATSFGTGMVKDTLERPVEGAAVLGTSFIGGYAFKGVEMVGVAAAPKVVAYSPKLAKAGSLLWKATPYVMTGLYGENVASRSTEQYTNFKPGDVSSNLGGITATEAIPMGVGLKLGYNRNPKEDYLAVKTKATDIGLELKNVKWNGQSKGLVYDSGYELGPNDLELHSTWAYQTQSVLMEKPSGRSNYLKSLESLKKLKVKTTTQTTQKESMPLVLAQTTTTRVKPIQIQKTPVKQTVVMPLALAQTTTTRVKPIQIQKTPVKQTVVMPLTLAQTTKTYYPKLPQLTRSPLKQVQTVKSLDTVSINPKPTSSPPLISNYKGIPPNNKPLPKPKEILKTPTQPLIKIPKPKVWKPNPKTPPPPFVPKPPKPLIPIIPISIGSRSGGYRLPKNKSFFGFREEAPTWTPQQVARAMLNKPYKRVKTPKTTSLFGSLRRTKRK